MKKTIEQMKYEEERGPIMPFKNPYNTLYKNEKDLAEKYLKIHKKKKIKI